MKMVKLVKPQIIVHRVNTIAQLKKTETYLGVEIDLRSKGSKIILQHDPFCYGEAFEVWLDYYKHNTIILNVKEEGLEKTITSLLLQRNIKNYFFLDVSFPFMVWLSNEGMRDFAVRLSEYESLETVLNMKGRVKYVWVDCFTKSPLNQDIYNRLKAEDFKICIASWELQNHDIDAIEGYAEALWEQEVYFDAVCTKRPELWQRLISKNL